MNNGEFVINTPCESAQKYWIGGAAKVRDLQIYNFLKYNHPVFLMSTTCSLGRILIINSTLHTQLFLLNSTLMEPMKEFTLS